MAAYQAPPSLGSSRQERWSGLPFPSPRQESEKWKWSRSVVSDSSPPHGLQPTRLLRPWEFPGKSTGVGCHWQVYIEINPVCQILCWALIIKRWRNHPWSADARCDPRHVWTPLILTTLLMSFTLPMKAFKLREFTYLPEVTELLNSKLKPRQPASQAYSLTTPLLLSL